MLDQAQSRGERIVSFVASFLNVFRFLKNMRIKIMGLYKPALFKFIFT